jgi:hypothetical protein
MDSFLSKLVYEESTPKFNPLLSEGVPVSQLKLTEAYVDKVMHCAAMSFDPRLEFVRSIRCTPEEEFQEIIKPRYGHGKHTYELAQSDVYLQKMLFKWEGQLMEPRYLYLPFVRQAGTMHIRGPLYTVSSVIADVSISVAKNGLFMPMTRDKLTIDRTSYSFGTNTGSETSWVVWSAIHRYAKDNAKRVGVTCTLAHYLFCKYGLQQTFKKFANTDIVVGNREINNNSYPEDKWVICHGHGIAPKGVYQRNFTPHTTRIAIPKENWNHLTKSLMAGLFYVLDHFSYRANPAFFDDPRYWRILMGRIIFRSDHDGKLALDVDVHMESLDQYVDQMVIQSLEQSGIYCNDIYEFFIYVINNIHDIIMGADLASMYGKKLMVLRYVLLDITRAIFEFTYKLNNNGKKVLDRAAVVKTMGTYFNRDLIFNLSRQHGEVSNITIPGDSTMLKHTSNAVLQEDATGRRSKGKGRGVISNPSKMLHASIIECGSYIYLPKSDPTGRNRLNPFVQTTSDGLLVRDPDRVALLDNIQAAIQR